MVAPELPQVSRHSARLLDEFSTLTCYLPVCSGVHALKVSHISHYYTNDFARHYPNINRGGHKIQLPYKMLEDLWRRPQLTVSQNAFIEVDILFMEAVRNVRLDKWIYGDGKKCPPW
jgi:hypothetical protein